jgi:hypothetical protein
LRRRDTPCNRSALSTNRWAEQDPRVEGGGQPALRPPAGCVPVRGSVWICPRCGAQRGPHPRCASSAGTSRSRSWPTGRSSTARPSFARLASRFGSVLPLLRVSGSASWGPSEAARSPERAGRSCPHGPTVRPLHTRRRRRRAALRREPEDGDREDGRYIAESVTAEGTGRAVRDAHAKGYGVARGEVEASTGSPPSTRRASMPLRAGTMRSSASPTGRPTPERTRGSGPGWGWR